MPEAVADDGARFALGGKNARMVVVSEDGLFPRRRVVSFEIVVGIGHCSHGRWPPRFWCRSCRPSSMVRRHGRAWADCTARDRGLALELLEAVRKELGAREAGGIRIHFLHKFVASSHVSQSHQPVGRVLQDEIDSISAALFGIELASVDSNDGKSWIYSSWQTG